MPRGGFRPGAGRKKNASPAKTGQSKTAPATPPQKTSAPLPLPALPFSTEGYAFSSAHQFGLWAINDPNVTMDQKIRVMQSLLPIEAKEQDSAKPSKKEQEAEAIEKTMQGRFAPRTVRGFGVVTGDKA